MRHVVDWQRFDAESLRWFYRLLGATLLSRIATDVWANLWAVHAGVLFPWRHLPGVPLYPPAGLLLEWAAMGVAALGLLTGVQRVSAVRLALLVSVVSLTQRYANHRALLLIVLLFLALSPIDPGRRALASERHPNLALIRTQLVIVYLFSALNKIGAGFLDGGALEALLGLPQPLSAAAAWTVVAAELVLPLLLWRVPAVGLVTAGAMHLGFALALPGIWPFSLLMLAMAALFFVPATKRAPDAAVA